MKIFRRKRSRTLLLEVLDILHSISENLSDMTMYQFNQPSKIQTMITQAVQDVINTLVNSEAKVEQSVTDAITRVSEYQQVLLSRLTDLENQLKANNALSQDNAALLQAAIDAATGGNKIIDALSKLDAPDAPVPTVGTPDGNTPITDGVGGAFSNTTPEIHSNAPSTNVSEGEPEQDPAASSTASAPVL